MWNQRRTTGLSSSSSSPSHLPFAVGFLAVAAGCLGCSSSEPSIEIQFGIDHEMQQVPQSDIFFRGKGRQSGIFRTVTNMSSATTRQLLRTACSLVPAHGFTREALSRSVLHLPEPHTVPLSDTAVSALFGGHQANKCLVNAWLEKGLEEMKEAANPTIRATLHARLRYNEPVLQYLPEVCFNFLPILAVDALNQAFGMLAAPGSISFRRPPPVLEHPARIADAACRTSGDQSLHVRLLADGNGTSESHTPLDNVVHAKGKANGHLLCSRFGFYV